MTHRTPGWLWGLCALAAIIVGQLIGTQRFEWGDITIVLLPLVFAFAAGLALNPAIVTPLRPLLGEGAGERASRLVGPSVMPLIVVLTVGIGAQFNAVMEAGPALIAQEFGNIATMAISMPVAVLLFRMGREAVGATFSIAREGGLAFIFDKYGANSAEAIGVMGVYICGTFFGTAVFAIMPPLIESFGIFDIRALAMACGTGSASMTGACATSLEAVDPERADLIGALAAGSNLASGLLGLFVYVFLTVPLAEAYYRALTRIAKAVRRDD
ncbi:MAG: DUF3100 domain-containing protein [Pseudomonadota bacterium]